jgi:DNA repair protein RecN (Recombination protein N)
VARELPPLKLDQARFVTSVRPEGAQRGPAGHDQVEFQIATNPGANPGPLKKIASGGELARFILALKVCLAETGAASTLVFDEVDKGIGGAVADAVGLRLAKLSRQAQVLVVTHSPQVAARADHQWRIAKSGEAVTRTDVEPLDTHQRKEEIARMLSGAEITQEARMAADRLLAEAEVARV